MLYSCTHMATVSVRGLTMNSDSVTRQHAVVSRPFCFLLLCYITKFLFLLSTVLLHNVEGWFYEKRVFIGINRCIFRRKKTTLHSTIYVWLYLIFIWIIQCTDGLVFWFSGLPSHWHWAEIPTFWPFHLLRVNFHLPDDESHQHWLF